jgi:hypothetical protein
VRDRVKILKIECNFLITSRGSSLTYPTPKDTSLSKDSSVKFLVSVIVMSELDLNPGFDVIMIYNDQFEIGHKHVQFSTRCVTSLCS